MQTPGKKPRVFRDPKHFLANRLEAILNRDPNWEAFTQKIGRSRSALQKTELAHFVPPPFKTKAPFMNLEPTIHWAATVVWHLDHPESISRKDVTAERMNEKMGWLREFATSIQQWQECQKVISTTLTFLNQQGIFRGLVKQYRQVIAGIATSTVSQQLVNDTEALLCECEKKLKPHERLRISTEILESGFARYSGADAAHVCRSPSRSRSSGSASSVSSGSRPGCYRVGILMYGKKPTFPELVKWVRHG